jgi:hypothetical protein
LTDRPIQVLKNAWQKVIDSIPHHQITGNKVAEILDENPQSHRKYKLADQLAKSGNLLLRVMLE